MTAVFELPATEASYVVEKPAFTVAAAGDIDKVTGCKLMVTVADADSGGTLAEMTVIVATPVSGTVAGPV
jgi:hypothetical protein